MQPGAQAPGESGNVTSPAGAKETTHYLSEINREAFMAEPTYEEMKAKPSQLEKEVETKKRSGDLIFKVGEKGGVSVYGLGRFPITLYPEQWEKLLSMEADIRAFIAVHFDGDKILIDNFGDLGIFVTLAVDDVAPVAPDRANIQKNGFVF